MARIISCCAFICIYNVPIYNIYIHIYHHISNSILRYKQHQTTNIHAYSCHAETLLNARRMASTVELVQPFEGVVDVRWHEGRKPWSFRVCNIWNAMRWRVVERIATAIEWVEVSSDPFCEAIWIKKHYRIITKYINNLPKYMNRDMSMFLWAGLTPVEWFPPHGSKRYFAYGIQRKIQDFLGLWNTLLGTNISPTKAFLKMIFLFPGWDMLVP